MVVEKIYKAYVKFTLISVKNTNHNFFKSIIYVNFPNVNEFFFSGSFIPRPIFFIACIWLEFEKA